MAIEHTILPKLNFVLSRLTGAIDDLQLMDHVRTLNILGQGHVGLRELADCRKLESITQASVSGALDAAIKEAGQARAETGKLAILVASEEVYNYAQFYKAGNSGIRETLITYELAEALDWLGYVDAERAQILGQLEQD
jgi:hypothetical protein